jgi:acetyl-CoA carboxylase biotin carboxyl carrier protein
MTIDEIKELLQIFNESGVGELEVQRGEDRLRIKRAATNKEYIVAPAPQPQPMAAAPAAPAITATAAAPARALETDGMLV